MHPVKVPTAIERYQTEAKRILSVLEGELQEKEWLVGDKCTFADLSFVPWNDRMDAILLTAPGEDMFDGFPRVKAWHGRMTARPSWKTAVQIREALMREAGLVWPRKVPEFERATV
jgi:glutathione S-transferase